MRWHLGGSADVFAVVKTHSFVQGTVGRKLPAGISSDDKSLTREKEEGDRCGKRRAIGPQGKPKCPAHSAQKRQRAAMMLRGLCLGTEQSACVASLARMKIF